MSITTLRCPECGTDVRMGLPRGSTVKAVTEESKPDPDGPGRKVRENVCGNGHEFYVHFVLR